MQKIAGLIIAVVAILLMQASCGGLRNQNSIYATDYITGESLSIKLKVKRAYSAGQTYFSINKDLTDLAADIIKADSSLSVVIDQENETILIDTGTDYFSIIEVEKINEDKESDHRYLFFATMRQETNKASGYRTDEGWGSTETFYSYIDFNCYDAYFCDVRES
jgi:hypothetical protein